MFLPVIYAEPSTAPTGFSALSKDSSSVTLTWDELPCSDQNGPLLGYVISHAPDGGTASTAALPIGSNKIAGLTSCAKYTFTIAAWNSAGFGPFSPQLAIITSGIGKGLMFLCVVKVYSQLCSLHMYAQLFLRKWFSTRS